MARFLPNSDLTWSSRSVDGSFRSHSSVPLPVTNKSESIFGLQCFRSRSHRARERLDILPFTTTFGEVPDKRRHEQPVIQITRGAASSARLGKHACH